MVQVYKQLSIFLANVPGTLAQVLSTLAKAKINIIGLMVNDSIDHAVIRLVVDNPTKAAHLLGDEGLLVIESDVLGVVLQDEPGALLKVAGTLAKAKANIAYTYATDGTNGAVMAFIRPTNVAKAKKALAAMHKKKKAKKKARKRS
jgi:hypothetical protein